MRYKFLVIFFSLIFLITGCGIKQSVMGEFYLSSKKYKDGIHFFQDELHKNPNDPKVQYYLGRYYLADNQPKDGLIYLKKAIELDFFNADYQFWIGVAYAENKQTKMEWKSYEKALKLNPNHLKSRIYLAHSQVERKLYKNALANYSIVLKEWPDEPACLYNRALALKHLQRTKEEKIAWKEYLDFYPSGPMANTAVEHLNSLGDFSYRNHIIGLRTITLRKIQFEPFSAKLTAEAKETLDFVREVLTTVKDVSIHIVVYHKNNKKLAEQKAKNIKKYLIEQYTKIGSSRIKISWFEVSESIRVDNKSFREDESVNFFTAT
ncbi:MAG: tetratricopeptide repeat protein [Elusimicrobiota bacterium]